MRDVDVQIMCCRMIRYEVLLFATIAVDGEIIRFNGQEIESTAET